MKVRAYITKEFSFEAAHHLIGYDGDCSRVHGHSYKLQVTASGLIDTSEYQFGVASDLMVMDFKDLNKIVKDNIIKTHDHADLNKLYHNPTAEVMVCSMFSHISQLLPADVQLESVKLWETVTSFAECKGGSFDG